jgi:hypothetical protein
LKEFDEFILSNLNKENQSKSFPWFDSYDTNTGRLSFFVGYISAESKIQDDCVNSRYFVNIFPEWIYKVE